MGNSDGAKTSETPRSDGHKEPPPDGNEDAFFRDKAGTIARFTTFFVELVPQNKALGMQVIDVSRGTIDTLMPYAPHLVGDPESGTIHGGAITTLIDATCGASVFLKILRPVPVATLDLRIDYMRPAEPGRDVRAHAHCYHLTKNIAFVRGVAYHDKIEHPIASAAGTFMIQTPGQSLIIEDTSPKDSKGSAA